MSWIRPEGDGVMLTLHIQPGAKKSEVVGLHGDALKIRLAAPPVDGKANAALLAFVADGLDLPRSRVLLVSGETSRAKRLRVSGVTVAEVEARFGPRATARIPGQ